MVCGWLELREPAGDRGDLLLYLNRSVVSHTDREQSQRPVAQLVCLERGVHLDRYAELTALLYVHSSIVAATPDTVGLCDRLSGQDHAPTT